jgi:chorismate dehydratase
MKRSSIMDRIHLIEDYPARIAQMLIDDQVDVGLIPVAATLRMESWNIVGDYCIGADGAVASVCIFSEVPMEDVTEVVLDYQSRTSVNLAKVLLREYWKKKVSFIDASGEDFREHIKGTRAGVVIGDRALEQRHRSTFIYDLGEAWKQHTGLPFVFAAWIANKELPEDFKAAFNEATGSGLQHLTEVIAENPFKSFDLCNYYTQCIDYRLDEAKKKGLALFLQKLKDYQSQTGGE